MMKKPIEFSKIAVIATWLLAAVWISLSYGLAFIGFEPNSDVTVVIVTEVMATTIAYFGYQAVLKTSRNKNEIDAEGVPYKWHEKIEEQFGDIEKEEIKDLPDEDNTDNTDEATYE